MDELKKLIALLRECGVTRYEGLNDLGERVVLELGPAPAAEPKIDLNREGFVVSNGRSPELNAALARLDPQYSDRSLFAIDESKR